MLQRSSHQSCPLHKRVSSSVEAFAPLPSVAMKVMSVVADPETTAKELETVLQGDISLVTAVLKLANSAFYGLRRQVISLRHALLLLGRSEVQGLVLSRVMFQAFKVPKGLQKDVMAGVWRHSLECALAAEYVAEQCGEEGSVYFLGGMLHDIGKLLILQQFSTEIEDLEHYSRLAKKEGVEVETALLGCGHNELGSQLLHRWMFPTLLVEMVQSHHDYDEIRVYERPVQVLIIADLLSRWAVLKNLEGDSEEQRDSLSVLLQRCGAESKIIPDKTILAEMESGFRQRLQERKELLEMLML
ncbi:putative domain HDIG-containing protein [Desulfocapsa sulfexigens DSM 10523]|uniref:Putative domain HDIG-containing protein n=1 Tax=Desulfocapsa sulfexigens (strain DSM 10523 / SB164P1) TaxID=1167006 RepID=M1P3U0_DESSD|nr:HDOD domain-containing protein [Desulfocapsa sulfexigens]AGF78148.1 putative domain HDIG-containing protein [Desulfocapsa sulfexigens DSM 10523]